MCSCMRVIHCRSVIDVCARPRRVRVQRLARRMLQQIGCTVLEASDGDEVPAMLHPTRTGPPIDIILMDIEMERVNGTEAVAAARTYGCAIPIFAVTGNADASDIAACACGRRVRPACVCRVSICRPGRPPFGAVDKCLSCVCYAYCTIV